MINHDNDFCHGNKIGFLFCTFLNKLHVSHLIQKKKNTVASGNIKMFCKVESPGLRVENPDIIITVRISSLSNVKRVEMFRHWVNMTRSVPQGNVDMLYKNRV